MGFEVTYKINKKMVSFLYQCISVTRFFSYLKYKKIRRKNKTLFNNKKSDKVVILGLGPSLNDFDFKSKGLDTIVVNRFVFYDKQKKTQLEPNYYCFADNAFYNEDLNVLLESYSYFKNTYFVLNGKYIRNVKNISSSDNVFFGFFQKAFCDPKKKIDFRKRIPMNVNVVGLAIELALYLGYKEIYLYGLDFTSALTKKFQHAYNEEEKIDTAPFRITYYYYSLTYEQFHCYDEYAKLRGIKIINKSKISIVDCFDFD